jgi:hypothetical protein
MAQHMIFVCQQCGRAGEAPLEAGDELHWEARGTRICADCLERMFGLTDGAWRSGESSD